MYVGAVEEMMCFLCGCVLQRGHSGDGCDLVCRLCVLMMEKGLFACSECKGATSDAWKYLFRAANVWWRYAQYLLLPLVARWLEAIDVCIWRFYVCCSDCVGVCVNVFCAAGVVKDSVLALEW